jgi:hypothetical protein
MECPLMQFNGLAPDLVAALEAFLDESRGEAARWLDRAEARSALFTRLRPEPTKKVDISLFLEISDLVRRR